MMKNTISRKVSETAPLIGQASRTTPAAMPRTAETNDHQKPGACRAQNVVIKPTTPLIRNNQPMNIATAIVASTGTMIARAPRISRMMPSTRNMTQCSRTDWVIARCISLMSPGFVDTSESPSAHG